MQRRTLAFTPPDLFELYHHHAVILREACGNRVPAHAVPAVTAEALYWFVRYLGPSAHTSEMVHHVLDTYTGALLKGFAGYLLLHKNTHSLQGHCLLKDDTRASTPESSN